MAIAPKPEFPPLLAPGFHGYRLDALRALCVDQFQGSLTRGAIMDGFEQVVAMLNAGGLKMELWVDGSFLTAKLNPDDVDFAARVDEADWRSATAQQKSLIGWLNATDLRPSHRCDAYGFVDFVSLPNGAGEWGRAYWLRQFGFSRADNPKGMATLQLPFVIT